MKYESTDRDIRVGDRIHYAGMPGLIVFIINDDSYCDRYPREHWAYLGTGLGVEIQDGTLYHLDGPDEDLEYGD